MSVYLPHLYGAVIGFVFIAACKYIIITCRLKNTRDITTTRYVVVALSFLCPPAAMIGSGIKGNIVLRAFFNLQSGWSTPPPLVVPRSPQATVVPTWHFGNLNCEVCIYCETFISVCNQPPRSTQPGHPFVDRHS